MYFHQRDSVCKGCEPPKRHIGCHSDCEAYIADMNETEALRKEIMAKMQNDLDYYSFKANNIRKTERKYGKKK